MLLPYTDSFTCKNNRVHTIGQCSAVFMTGAMLSDDTGRANPLFFDQVVSALLGLKAADYHDSAEGRAKVNSRISEINAIQPTLQLIITPLPKAKAKEYPDFPFTIVNVAVDDDDYLL